MWRFDDIAIINEVISQGSFIAAAKKLNMPSSTVSRRVAELESQLKVRLLERNAKKMCLTKQGEYLFEKCKPHLTQIKACIQEITQANKQVQGSIKITAPVTLANELLNDWFCEFSMNNRDLYLNVNLTNQFEDILDNSIDIAFRVGPLKDSQFIAQFLFSTPMVLCASKSYLLTNSIATIDDLTSQHWLVYSSDQSKITFKHKDNLLVEERIVNPCLSSNNTQILKQACVKGLGIAYLPKISITEELHAGTLIELLPQYHIQQSRDVYMVYPSKKYLSATMAAFLKFIKYKAELIA